MANETMQRHMGKDYTLREHVKAALDEIDKHESQMKHTMEQSINSAKSNYKFKARVNIHLRANVPMIIIGIVLIANPIVFFWLKGIGMIPHSEGSSELTYFNYFLL
jgi:hypothetical protein